MNESKDNNNGISEFYITNTECPKDHFLSRGTIKKKL